MAAANPVRTDRKPRMSQNRAPKRGDGIDRESDRVSQVTSASSDDPKKPNSITVRTRVDV